MGVGLTPFGNIGWGGGLGERKLGPEAPCPQTLPTSSLPIRYQVIVTALDSSALGHWVPGAHQLLYLRKDPALWRVVVLRQGEA